METRFGIVALVVQAAFVVLFAVFADYGPDADARVWGNATGELEAAQIGAAGSFGEVYPLFQDVHVMIFIGFGFLMAYMKWYGFSGIGLNMLLAALVVQWSLIVNGLFHLKQMKFRIDTNALLSADFACATVLITFGAVLGRTSPLQSLVLALVEVPLFVANEFVGLNKFMAADIGGSMFVHVFGAYFGIAAAKTLVSKRDSSNPNDQSHYYSDHFAMIGSLFLWVHWPSFNAGLATGDDRERAVINTYLSLAASTVVAFAVSSLVEKGRFEMAHVQNSTLAGGVAIGTVANMMVAPWVALLVGGLAGAVSVLGFAVVSPKLKKRHFLDTCGVNNLHGLPGILAALFGILFAGLANFDNYGYSLYQIFPARAPPPTNGNSTFTFVTKDGRQFASGGVGRSAPLQAVFQAAALSMTLLCAIVGGLLTGFLLKLEALDRLRMENFYIDSLYWLVPEDLGARPHNEASHSKKKEANELKETKQEAEEETGFLQDPAADVAADVAADAAPADAGV